MATVKTSRLIVAAILAILVYGMIAAMLGTLLPNLSTKFGLTPEQSGDIAFAQALGLIVASVLSGPLIDNRGKKTGLVASLILIAGALFALPNSGSPLQVMIWMFVLGLGGATLVTAGSALASDINPERRATTLNLLNLFFGLGGLATPLIAANFLAGNAIALCYLVAALTVATLLFNSVTVMPPPSGERGFKFSEIGTVLGQPALYLLSFFMFLYVACEVGVWNWLPKHLIAQGVPEGQALRILSLGFALGLLIGRLVVSRILVNVAAATVTLASSALMAVTTYLALQTGDPTVAWLAVFCAGLAMAPVFPTTVAMAGDAFPKATATAMGIVLTCGWVGLAVSSKVIGGIAGGDDQKLKAALLVVPVASVIMVVVNLLLRPIMARKKASAG
ncbi:MAG TPA: MFS transporter [Bryobacteraceae bacterium]|nr:MFS transporter [Bryobacteraceae bacterium]